MVNKRCESLTFRCTWCNRIQTGKSWIPERRRVQKLPYASSVCQRCKSFYLTGFDFEDFVRWCQREVR
jgi:hypothetical protein